MIARLCGTLVDKHPGSAVVDVGGVGYQLSIPLSTYAEIGEPGSRVELHVHTHVREDALALFGFHTRFEKEVFTRLLAVSGIVLFSYDSLAEPARGPEYLSQVGRAAFVQ